jgi:hypothetical protein
MARVNAEAIIRRLASFPAALRAAVAGVMEDEARWRPPHPRYPAGAWSILEVVCHLGDEEVEDFRARVAGTLRDPAAPWAPIDPEGWAVARRYNERDLGEALVRFAAERRASVDWLRSLSNPDWSIAHAHPTFGPIRAGDLLASWAAHDALHLRQIAKRLHELAARDAAEFRTRYAGEWGA